MGLRGYGQLVGSRCIAQGAQICDNLEGWDGDGRGRFKREAIYVFI